MAALAACSLLGAVPAQAGISAPTRVVIGLPTASVYWQTAFTNVVPVYWGEYPSAASAILSAALASGPASTETFSASGGDTEWALPGGADEELYELSLRFLDSGGNDVKTLSARVARVKSATPVDMTKDAGDGRSLHGSMPADQARQRTTPSSLMTRHGWARAMRAWPRSQSRRCQIAVRRLQSRLTVWWGTRLSCSRGVASPTAGILCCCDSAAARGYPQRSGGCGRERESHYGKRNKT